MRQRLSNPKLKWWQGILLILGIVLALLIIQFAAAAYALYMGGANARLYASAGFWVFGILLALLILRHFIMEYEYSLEGLILRVDRIYGRMRPRMAVQIVTRKIAFVGTPEDAQAKYPGAHPTNYTRGRTGIALLAIAHETARGVRLIHIQPDDALRARLLKIQKENLP